MSDFVKVGKKTDFPLNQTKGVRVNDVDVCVANDNGALTAFDDSCTHAAAPLSECPVEKGLVTCPLHGARFDVKTGVPKTLPATEPLHMHFVKAEGDDVLVKLNEEPGS